MMSVAKECGEFHMLLNENPRGNHLWGIDFSLKIAYDECS